MKSPANSNHNIVLIGIGKHIIILSFQNEAMIAAFLWGNNKSYAVVDCMTGIEHPSVPKLCERK